MNAMVPGLAGGKMSSSDPNSKIDFLDSPELVRKKVKAAFCEEGNVEDNGLLAFAEAVLFPASQLRQDHIKEASGASVEYPLSFVSENAPEGTLFSIERDEKFGGSLHYSTFADMKADFASKAIHPKDLKVSVGSAINKLLDPIRADFQANEEWRNIEKLAYPDPNAKDAKKKKKVRDLPYPSSQTKFGTSGKGLPSATTWEREECSTSAASRGQCDDGSCVRGCSISIVIVDFVY